MRKLNSAVIKKAIAELCIKANTQLRPDVLAALKRAYQREKKIRAKDILGAIIKNAALARGEGLAICQDTGMPCIFVELGSSLKIVGNLNAAINKGVESGYKKGYLRNSVVNHPLSRNRLGYKPVIIHLDLVKGSNLRLTVLPKGFGCENKTKLKMFLPTAGIDEIKQFVVDSVGEAGPDACPPYIVGVGIGGTADFACLLAKKALLKNIKNQTSKIPKLEKDLLSAINRLHIGPMGLGGRATCLGVNIKTHPTHIAGLPVAVNISCHALRSATKKL
ncbi:MAG: fumarate hydratase [Candidatus Omnitrophota bacterium]|jgi:fumarate hydratase subunit alpha